jgi:biopolymer transport protein ExbB
MKKLLLVLSLLAGLTPLSSSATWNSDWANQKKIGINALGVTPGQSQFPVVVRLHSGNFDFTSANVDGSDLRFIAADDKTELKFHIEKYDSVNELAVIWVQMVSTSPS